MKPRVVVTHWVHPQVLELLSEHCDVTANPSRKTLPRDEVIRRTGRADALMAFMPDIVDEEFLRACPRLRVVAAALKGFDNFAVETMTRRDIWFTMIPDLLTVPTAELAITLLLGLTRRVLEGDRFVRGGQFSGWRPELYGTGLHGRVLGIVGIGAIGRAIAQRLAGFDVKILYYDKLPLTRAEEIDWGSLYVSLPQLLSLSDFVILCVPLKADTFHLIDAQTIAAMKRGSYLVNVCRGSVVDERAVAQSLESGHLSGYAADVFEMEDWQCTDRPSVIPPTLIDKDSQTLFTPHLGSAVEDIRRDIELRAATNILQALRGETPYDAVNRPIRSCELSQSL